MTLSAVATSIQVGDDVPKSAEREHFRAVRVPATAAIAGKSDPDKTGGINAVVMFRWSNVSF